MNMDYEFKNRGNLRMDIFSEQIIKRKFCAKDALIITASVIVAVIILLLTLAIPLLSMFAILILAGVCFAFYYMVTSIDWEFEYSITNHDFTCDKIIHRRKRKRQFSVDLHETEEMGKYEEQKFTGRNFDAVYQVGKTAKGTADNWYISGHFEKYGRMLIIFSPDDRILNAIRPSLKRSVSNAAFPHVPQGKC
jgi:hypothetical protein